MQIHTHSLDQVVTDVRFPEMYIAMRKAGAQILLVPSAFTLHTGKDHWEVLLGARSIENQVTI